MIDALAIDQHVEDFIKRWENSSKNERANFQMFAQELCDLIEVARPDPATEDASSNPYTFERSVDFKSPDGSISKGRIDL